MSPRRRAVALVLLALALAAGAGGAFLALRSPPAPVATAGEEVRTADEAEIASHRPERLTVFRFAPNPRVLVLDFPTLDEQGRMLNRVAALVEKAGLPRDRVLSADEMAEAIRAEGATPASYYYGHDYRAADLVRFFDLAARDGVALDDEEERLRRLLHQEGWTDARAAGALISVPRVGSDAFVDEAARRTILRHELSHGEYFTAPAYAAYVARFWREALSGEERAAIRAFLARSGYDARDEDLMMNEAQAYLVHTPDPRFCSPRDLGLTPERFAVLRAEFLRNMPPSWLRDADMAALGPLPAPSLPALPAASPRPARAPRRQRGAVSRVKAVATTRSPRRRAASIAAARSRR